MALIVGSLLNNRYRIERVLAKGGMGAVYRGVDESLGVPVAVKENLYSTDQSSRQFFREATFMASLKHPNLPRVTDHFILPNQGQYLVMDYIEGEDLKDRLADTGPIPWEEVIRIAEGICDALTYMHKQKPPIIHRDIKPGNIKITPEKEVYLVDFGLAKEAKAGEVTEYGAQALTPGFAPPEQYGRGTDGRSDVYALGATLYAALTAQTPEDALSCALGNLKITPIRQHNPDIPENIASAIEIALNVAPEDRYQTAADFKKALLEAEDSIKKNDFQSDMESTMTAAVSLENEATYTAVNAPSLAPESTWESGRSFDVSSQPKHQEMENTPSPVQMSSGSDKSKKATPWIMGVVGGGIVLCIIIIAGVVIFSKIIPSISSGRPTSTNTVQDMTDKTSVNESTTVKTQAGEMPLTGLVKTPTATENPSTQTPAPKLGGGNGLIAFVSDRTGIPQIWLMDPDGSKISQITDIAAGACEPDWSPDGTEIVFISPCSEKRSEYYLGSKLFTIKMDGSDLKPLELPPSEGDFDPDWSPDGKKIAFVSVGRIKTDRLAHLVVYDLETTNLIILAENQASRFPSWSPDGDKLVFEYTRGQQIWSIDADGQEKASPFIVGEMYSYSPVWSKQNMIAFGQQSSPLLMIKSFETGSQEINLTKEIRPVFNKDFSPDGNYIIFEVKKEKYYLYRIDITGVNLELLSDGSSNNFDPAWCP